MNDKDTAIDLRVRLNPSTNRLEISLLSENVDNATLESLANIFRSRNDDSTLLNELVIETAKTDPTSMQEGNRLRPMWEKVTCDIIK